MSDWERLLALDRERVWHPYGALPAALAPLPVSSARRGCACGSPTGAS